MIKANLNEREFELINIIGAKISTSQRELSRHMDLSLGMTNMLVRRLIAKGYIRIKQLNRRKVEYILTSKGFAEKMQKSVRYTLKTINSIGLIKSKLKKIFLKYYKQGERTFYILGRSDLSSLIDMVLKEEHVTNYTIIYIHDISEAKPEGLLFICKEGFDQSELSDRQVNLLQELSKDSGFDVQSMN